MELEWLAVLLHRTSVQGEGGLLLGQANFVQDKGRMRYKEDRNGEGRPVGYYG